MRRKEFFFKQLSFVIGIILICSFATGIETSLPLRSELKLVNFGDIFYYGSAIIINQEREKIHIAFLSSSTHEKPPFHNIKDPGIKDGLIPVSEFKSFWNSLDSLGFWKLKGSYSGISPYIGGVDEDYISVYYEKEDGFKITKIVYSNNPDFSKVHDLFLSVEKFAQEQPELEYLLKFGEDKKLLYQYTANAEIGRLKDHKYLDTLLILLPNEIKLSDGIIRALGKIGDKKAIPVLYKFLKNLDTLELPQESYFFPYLSHEQLTINTLNSIALIEGSKSSRIIKKYLNKEFEKYGPWFKFGVNIILSKLQDNSGINVLIDFLNNKELHEGATELLYQTSYKDKRLISAFIKIFKKEMKEREVNFKKIDGLISGLPKLTGQYFTSMSSDSLAAKKEIVNKWIDWWEANKDTFK